MLYHGSPRSHSEGLGTWSSDERLQQHLDSIDADVLVCAHTHRPMERPLAGGTVINVGAVGLPFNGDRRAQYAISLVEGVELTQRDLLSAFAKHRIEKVSPAMGEKFDPNLHQAMFETPTSDAKPGTVIEVMMAGFTIADRLLRPALVGVARAVPEPELEPEPESEKADAEPKGNGAD